MTRALLLLVACGGLPPELGTCEMVVGGDYGAVMEAGEYAGPAFSCDSYLRCEGGSYYDGRVYATGLESELVETSPGVWVTSEEEDAAAAALWCDRCRWASDHVMLIVPGAWTDLLADCDWMSP